MTVSRRLFAGREAGQFARWDGPLRFGAVVVAALVVIEAVVLNMVVLPQSDAWFIGIDFEFYRGVGQRFLDTGAFYWPHQLSGPYDVHLLDASGFGDVLYPPTALALFVPFAVLPAVLWWIVPVALSAYSVWRLQPATWAWMVMFGLLAWPRAIGAYLFGNTDIWMAAILAAGLVWGWPLVLLIMKPTFLPLALLGVRRRAWWVAVTILAATSLLMLPLWIDYITSVLNMRSMSLAYSLGSIPLLSVPVVAWIARRERSDERRVHDRDVPQA